MFKGSTFKGSEVQGSDRWALAFGSRRGLPYYLNFGFNVRPNCWSSTFCSFNPQSKFQNRGNANTPM
jgi:hypothetical protein